MLARNQTGSDAAPGLMRRKEADTGHNTFRVPRNMVPGVISQLVVLARFSWPCSSSLLCCSPQLNNSSSSSPPSSSFLTLNNSLSIACLS